MANRRPFAPIGFVVISYNTIASQSILAQAALSCKSTRLVQTGASRRFSRVQPFGEECRNRGLVMHRSGIVVRCALVASLFLPVFHGVADGDSPPLKRIDKLGDEDLRKQLLV